MANGMAAGRPGWSAWRIAGWGFAAGLLMLPAVAMRFTAEVDWDARDFIIMGIVIGGVGLGMEYLIRRSSNPFYRAGAVVALLVTVLTIWVNLAVGMIGDDNPYNLLFAGVLGIALIGSILARFTPAGMALTMLLTALAQGIAGAGGLASDPRGGHVQHIVRSPLAARRRSVREGGAGIRLSARTRASACPGAFSARARASACPGRF